MNYYKILGVNKDTSYDEIKKKYKKLARKYHPDKNPNKDTSKKFKEVTEAYKTLSDPHTRSKYDIMFGNKDFSGITNTFNNIDMNETFNIFNDIFSIFQNNSFFNNQPFIDGKPFFKDNPFKNFPPVNINNMSSQYNPSMKVHKKFNSNFNSPFNVNNFQQTPYNTKSSKRNNENKLKKSTTKHKKKKRKRKRKKEEN